MNWEYIAGFFDGEGCVTGLSGGNGAVVISQQKPQVLEKIQDFLNQRQIVAHLYPPIGKRNGYQLVLGCRDDKLNFLRAIFPYLIVKKTATQDFIRYFVLFPNLRRFKRNKNKNDIIGVR